MVITIGIILLSFLDKQELRIEDYDAGRKSGATGGTSFPGLSTSTSSGGGGLFGNTGTSGFGSSGFGQKSTTGLGGTSGTVLMHAC